MCSVQPATAVLVTRTVLTSAANSDTSDGHCLHQSCRQWPSRARLAAKLLLVKTYRGCEGSTLDVVALALNEGDPAGHCEDHKGGHCQQRVRLDLLEDVKALGQLKECCHGKAQHGQAAVDDLRAQTIIGLDLCMKQAAMVIASS